MADSLQKIVEIVLKLKDTASAGFKQASASVEAYSKTLTTVSQIDAFKDIKKKIDSSRLAWKQAEASVSSFEKQIRLAKESLISQGQSVSNAKNKITELSAALTKSKAEAERYSKTFKSSNEAIEDFEKKSQKLKTVVKDQEAELRAAKKELESLSKGYKESAKALQDYEKENTEAKKTATALKNEHINNLKALRNISAQLKQAGVNTKNLAAEEARLIKALKQAKAAADAEAKAEKARGDIGIKSNRQIKAEIDKLIRAYKTLKDSGRASGNELKRAAEEVKAKTTQLKTEMAGLQGALGKVATAAAKIGVIVGAILFPVKIAADFQQGMSKVGAISGATGKALRDLTDKAKEVGSTTKFSAAEAADGMRFLAMAGFEASQIIGSIKSSADLAAAGNLELAQSADIVTNIMTGYGITTSELTSTVDTMVRTFTSANTTLPELGEAFKYVGPIAVGVGAEFEDVAVALGALHNAGIKASMAGTTLRGILDALYNPTKAEKEQIDGLASRLGDIPLQIKNASGEFVGFTELVRQLEQAGLGADEALKLFGLRAGPGMAALLKQGSTELLLLDQRINHSEVSADALAKSMLDNLYGAFTSLSSAIQGLAISGLWPLVKSLTVAIKKIAELTRALANWSNKHEVISGAIGTLVAGIASIAVAFQASKIFKWIASLAKFSSTLSRTSTVSGVLAKAAIGIKAALVALNITIGIAVAAFVALGASVVALYDIFANDNAIALWIGKFGMAGTQIGQIFAKIVSLIQVYLVKIGALWKNTFYHEPIKYLHKMAAEFIRGVIDMSKKLQKLPGIGKIFDIGDEAVINSLQQIATHFDGVVRVIEDGQRKTVVATNEAIAAHESLKRVIDEETEAAWRAEDAAKSSASSTEANEAAITKLTEAVKLQKKEKDKLSMAVGLAREQWQQYATQASAAIDGFAKNSAAAMQGLWREVANSAEIEEAQTKISALMDASEMDVMSRAKRIQALEKEVTAARISSVDEYVDYSVSSLDKEYEARKNVIDNSLSSEKERADALIELENSILERKQETYIKALSSIKDALKAGLAAEKDYADKIKNIQNSIESIKLSAEEKIRNIRRKGMSDAQRWADEERAATDYVNQGYALLAEGTTASIEAATGYFKKAQDQSSELARKVTDGGKVVKTEADASKVAINLIEDATRGLIAVKQREQEIALSNYKAQKSQNEELAASETRLASDLAQTQSTLAAGIEGKVTLDTKQFDSALQVLLQSKEVHVKALADLSDANAKLYELTKKRYADLEVEITNKKELTDLKKAIDDTVGDKTITLTPEIKNQKPFGNFVSDVKTVTAEGQKASIEVEVVKSEDLDKVEKQLKEIGKTDGFSLKIKTGEVKEEVDAAKKEVDSYSDKVIMTKPSLVVDTSTTFSSIAAVKKALDSIPKLIITKHVVEHTGTGSTERPIMDKLKEIAKGFRSLNGTIEKGAQYVVDITGKKVPISKTLEDVKKAFINTFNVVSKTSGELSDKLSLDRVDDAEGMNEMANKMLDTAKDHLSDLQSEWDNIDKQIKGTQDEILRIQTSSAAKYKEITYSMMSDDELLAAKRLEVQDMFAQAKLASDQGMYEQSKDYYLQAQDMASGLFKAYVDVTDKIQAITLKTDDIIRNLQQNLMTDYEVWESDRREAEKLAHSAREAELRGEYELAAELYQQSQKLAAGLAKDIKDAEGNTIKSLEETTGVALTLVRQTGEGATTALTAFQEEQNNAISETNSEAMKLMKDAETAAVNSMQNFQKELKEDQSETQSAIQQTNGAIDSLSKNVSDLALQLAEQHKIKVDTSEAIGAIDKLKNKAREAIDEAVMNAAMQIQNLKDAQAAGIGWTVDLTQETLMQANQVQSLKDYWDGVIGNVSQYKEEAEKGFTYDFWGTASSKKPLIEKMDEIQDRFVVLADSLTGSYGNVTAFGADIGLGRTQSWTDAVKDMSSQLSGLRDRNIAMLENVDLDTGKLKSYSDIISSTSVARSKTTESVKEKMEISLNVGGRSYPGTFTQGEGHAFISALKLAQRNAV